MNSSTAFMPWLFILLISAPLVMANDDEQNNSGTTTTATTPEVKPQPTTEAKPQSAKTPATPAKVEADTPAPTAKVPDDKISTAISDTFIPSESISEDLAVSFPVDI